MTRTLTVKEYLLEGLNRRARERGDDVELVFEWPKPRIAASDETVVKLHPASAGERTESMGNGRSQKVDP